MKRNADEPDALPPTDNVERVKNLLLFARAKGFRIGPLLEIGDVRMQISDIRQVKVENLDEQPVDPGVYGEHGLKDEDEPAPGTMG